jgi:DNA-binding Lrp family transcriptional regulator
MDNTDIALINLLLLNSRLSYAELAERLGLSVNAVHKRIQLLIESGVIRKFTAKLGPLANPYTSVFIWGTSQLSSVQALPEKLANQGSIYWLAVGGGKMLFIGAYLKTIGELAALVSYVKDIASIPEPTIGLVTNPIDFPPMGVNQFETTLCDLDYQIVNSLKDDARKPLSEVAELLGIATKTVRRRLTRMIKNHLIELTIEWYPDKSNDIITLIDLRLKADTKQDFPFKIAKAYSPHVLFFWSYANISNTVTTAFWTNTMKELQDIRENLEKTPEVVSVTPTVLYVGYIFKTWRDQIPKK